MVLFPESPEAGLGRSDSKNPATTCKGITSKGKPCRNPLGASARNSPAASPKGKGVIAILTNAGGSDKNAAAFYCYLHKDQAPSRSTVVTNSNDLELKNRTSIDTLMNRFGILDIDDETPKPQRESTSNKRPVKRNTLPPEWQRVSGPFLSVPNGAIQGNGASNQSRPQQSKRPARQEYSLSCFCCSGHGADEQAATPRPNPAQARMKQPTRQTASLPGRLQVGSPTLSQTSVLKSWIPDNVAPETYSGLLTELSKPLSRQDRDTGYIYMFWETPLTAPQPTRELTRSLFHDMWDHSDTRAPNALLPGDAVSRDPRNAARTLDADVRRTSDAMQQASQKKKIEVKIGRTDNVHLRMNQWTKQCGKNITLLRSYPHKSGTSSPSPSPGRSPKSGSQPVGNTQPLPVPNCARIERLIHLELMSQRIKKNCAGCGREHREWFEIDASKAGVRKVDEVIKRWVKWGHAKAAEERRLGSQDG